jgi:hypothetical protein
MGVTTLNVPPFRCGLFALLLLAALSGCGQKLREMTVTSVRGHVTLSGTPLQDGVVALEQPATGYAASSPLDLEGRFDMPEVPAGEYQITVTPPGLPPPGETPPPRPATMGPIRKIPAKYHLLATSGLTATVPAEGLAELVLELD